MRTREEIATTVRRLIHEKLEVKEFTDDTRLRRWASTDRSVAKTAQVLARHRCRQ